MFKIVLYPASRMKQTTLISLLIILVVPASLFSAPPLTGASLGVDSNLAPGSIIQFDHLTIEDGLSQNAGLAIFQDSRGYLWIGSQDGLNRYDGQTFQIFKHDPDEPNSISHNNILSITEDRDGFLWIGTWGGGLNRFDPATETFARYRADPNDSSRLSNDIVTSIKEDSSGALWVGTLGGLNRYNPSTDRFEQFKNDPNNPDSLSSDIISVIFEDSNHQLWVGTGANGAEGSGLNRFDPATRTAVRYQHDEADPQSLSSNNIASIYEAPDGTFWIATGGFSLQGTGLNQFDPRTGTVRRFLHDPKVEDSLSADDLMTLWGDSSGVLWVGTWSAGLDRMELARPGHFAHYRKDNFFPDSLSGNEVWSLYKDRAGTLWIGTSHSGINKLPANSGQFSLYRNNPSNPASLSTNAIGAFSEDRYGNIWIATWGAGLERFDPETGHFDHFRHDPENEDSLADDLFMDVYVDDYNTVWAGTLGKGLDSLQPVTGRATHYLHDPGNPASIADNNIAAIIPDQEGGLWIGTFGGLSHYDPSAGTFTNYSKDPANPSSLNENKVVSLYLDDQEHMLWIGTWGGGLSQLDLNDPLSMDPRQAAFISYRHDPDDPSTLSEDSVWAIHRTADGSLWLGTPKGLNRFDPAARTFTHYTEKNGLPNNVVLGILEDDSGNLWLTTNNGLAQFNPRAGTFLTYDASDGLQSNEFNSNAYYCTRRGILYIGGINGFNRFDPVDIKPNPVPPQVAVTRFEVFNEPLRVDLSGREPIQLSYKQGFISFEFAAFDFQAPHKNQYAYKLEGFDEDWIQAGSRRYATYTNLPGGEYVFRVKASNNDGIWNEQGLAVRVKMIPPPWRTWWAYGIYVLMAVGLLYGYGHRQAQRLEREAEYNRKLQLEVEVRTQELAQRNKELEAFNQKLEEASLTDSLTGFWNRRFFLQQIPKEIAQVDRIYETVDPGGMETRPPKSSLLFLMFDLDGFKGLNDTYGHAAGDRVLIQVRQMLIDACRQSDTIIRWGGDEFLLVGRNADPQTAENLAERIRSVMEEKKFDVGLEQTVHLSCSIGFAFYPFDPVRPTFFSWEQVIGVADRALYVAKESGRNIWAGILSTSRSRPADLLKRMNEDLETLVTEGVVELRDSGHRRPRLIREARLGSNR